MNFVLKTTLTALLITCGQAPAATFTVTSLFDSGPGSLRGCIAQANQSPGGDTIVFNTSLAGTLRPQSQMIVEDSVVIIGPSSRSVIIDGSNSSVLLNINNATSVEMGLIDLEFRSGGTALFFGISARLNVHRCVFRDFGTVSNLQAGVFNNNWSPSKYLTGTVHNSSFINNGGVHAGVIINSANPSGESLDFINCTFGNNHSSHGGSVAWIWNANVSNQGTTNFLSCTMTGNSGGQAGFASGTIENLGSVLSCRVRNCVLDENTAGLGSEPNFTGSGAPSARSLEGFNVFSNAGLEPLKTINGLPVRRPTQVSACLNTAVPDLSVLIDQLGQTRPYLAPGATPAAGSDGADVGAVERHSGGCGGTDLNEDGMVNTVDLVRFLGEFGTACP